MSALSGLHASKPSTCSPSWRYALNPAGLSEPPLVSTPAWEEQRRRGRRRFTRPRVLLLRARQQQCLARPQPSKRALSSFPYAFPSRPVVCKNSWAVFRGVPLRASRLLRGRQAAPFNHARASRNRWASANTHLGFQWLQNMHRPPARKNRVFLPFEPRRFPVSPRRFLKGTGRFLVSRPAKRPPQKPAHPSGGFTQSTRLRQNCTRH